MRAHVFAAPDDPHVSRRCLLLYLGPVADQITARPNCRHTIGAGCAELHTHRCPHSTTTTADHAHTNANTFLPMDRIPLPQGLVAEQSEQVVE